MLNVKKFIATSYKGNDENSIKTLLMKFCIDDKVVKLIVDP